MDGIPRRTLAELQFIYEHDAGRRDIYVEGPFDESIFRWVLKTWPFQSVAIYPITSIDIPDSVLICTV